MKQNNEVKDLKVRLSCSRRKAVNKIANLMRRVKANNLLILRPNKSVNFAEYTQYF